MRREYESRAFCSIKPDLKTSSLVPRASCLVEKRRTKLNDCILEPDKYCTECGKCNLCDLDPAKICDNCCKCLGDADFSAIEVTKIELPSPVKMKWKRAAGKGKGK